MAEVIARRAIAAALTRARGGSVPIPASPALYGATEERTMKVATTLTVNGTELSRSSSTRT